VAIVYNARCAVKVRRDPNRACITVAQGRPDPIAADDRHGFQAIPVQSAASDNGSRRAPPSRASCISRSDRRVRRRGLAFAFSARRAVSGVATARRRHRIYARAAARARAGLVPHLRQSCTLP
jgi:hypothetical protein